GLITAPAYGTPPAVATYNYWVRVVDADRGASALSNPLRVTWDTRPPDRPQIPNQFFGPPGQTITIRPGTVLQGSAVDFAVTAELIDSADRVLATGSAAQDPRFPAGLGTYRIALPPGLTGTMTLRVRFRDVAGNVSPT